MIGLPFASLGFGSLGLRGFFSLGGPSSTAFPSGPTSFFFRTLFFFSGAALFAFAAALEDVLPFWACAAVLVANAACAGVAEGAVATPPPKSWGFESRGRETLIVSEKPLFWGEIGGEEIDEELPSEAASSTCILSPKPRGIAIAVTAR